MKIFTVVATLLVALISTASFASKSTTSVESLRVEQSQINESINQAEGEDSKFSGGLIKALIGVRLELLKINSALVQQRINAIESGAKIKVKLYEVKPDPERVRNLQYEMDSIKSEIRAKEEEIAKYRGGLIKVTLMSSVATMNNTLAMLQTEHLKAKYGIYWMPDTGKKLTNTSLPPPSKKVAKTDRADERILVPTITNKRYDKYKYDENIWFDITWNKIGRASCRERV